VNTLATAAMQELDWLVEQGYVTGAQDIHKFRAQKYYEAHRFTTFFHYQDPTRTATKLLQHDYAPERVSWEKSRKQTNISGSKIHEWFKDLQADYQKRATGQQAQALYPVATEKLKKVLKKNVEALDDGDWAVVQAFLTSYPGAIMETAQTTQCLYLRKGVSGNDPSRLVALALIDQNGLFEDYDGQLLTTKNVGFNPPMYVMDHYGALYTDTSPAIVARSRTFNHSSIVSGNDVICAGNATIVNGQLRLINNNSGHYKPAKENLTNCLVVLQRENADLSQTVVVECRFSKTFTTGRKDYTYNSVANFLGGAAADSVADVQMT
jgi:hypothetical protein